VTVSIDAFAQSSEPLVQGILILVEQATAASRPKPDLHAAAPAPSVAKPAPPPRERRGWMRATGPWITGAGAALLAGGVAVSVMSRSLSDELDRKFQAGTLSAADLPSYRRVEQYDKLTRMLLASGAAVTLSGVAIWTTAPARSGAVAGLSGRF
jgi:hypothetical protein